MDYTLFLVTVGIFATLYIFSKGFEMIPKRLSLLKNKDFGKYRFLIIAFHHFLMILIIVLFIPILQLSIQPLKFIWKLKVIY